MQIGRALLLSLGLTLTTGLLFVPNSFGQIQSTITCTSGNWDVLSLMMMDPTLASSYHMEGDYASNGGPGSYMYTTWSQSENKVWYIKNPQGNPWDINLYDNQPSIASQGYVYQWVTELDNWPTPTSTDYWGDPKSCKKFNNGFDNENNHDSDESFIWAPRCGVPDGANSSSWNPTPTQAFQDYNSNYYVYIDQVMQSGSYNLDNALVELKGPGTIAIYWGGNNSTESWTANTISVQYTYTCSQENVNYCTDREVFDYAYDANPNPQDQLKHSYGWVHWRHYKNSSAPGDPANWGNPVAENTFNHVVSGQTTANFQCF
jgi:hypothetical protein